MTLISAGELSESGGRYVDLNVRFHQFTLELNRNKLQEQLITLYIKLHKD